MKKLIYILLVFCFSATAMKGQQDPMFTQYMFNMLTVNPAYAGSADLMTANAIYRNQWVNFEGAPVTQTLSIHSPLKIESLSVGGSIINDKHGPVKQTAIYGDVSYRIFMANSKLAFGLKGGVNLYSADLLSLSPNELNDPTFQSNISNMVNPNFGFGLLWYSKKHYIGLSAPKLISNPLIDGSLPSADKNGESQHFYFIAGYVFQLNNYVKFKPTLLTKVVNGAPPSVDLTANFLLYEKLWLGGMYRWQDAVGVLLQYNVNYRFRIGYSFDYTLSNISKYSSGTHEIMIGFDLGTPFGADISPRYF